MRWANMLLNSVQPKLAQQTRPGARAARALVAGVVVAEKAPAKPARKNPIVLPLLQEAWRIRLRLSGFHDLENPDDPDGPLSNAGQPSHLDTADAVTVQHAAAYYRRVGQLTERLPFHRDRAIAEAIADGHGIRTIKVTLRCGQSKIERVLRIIRSWIPETKWADKEDGGEE